MTEKNRKYHWNTSIAIFSILLCTGRSSIEIAFRQALLGVWWNWVDLVFDM